MWNAPLEIAVYADLACAAAMQMLASIGGVSDQWNHLLPNPLQLGIGFARRRLCKLVTRARPAGLSTGLVAVR